MTQDVVPMIAYEDAAAAIDWLTRAFGFEERGRRFTDEDGRVTHAELAFGDGSVYVATPTPDYRGPVRHAETCADARRWLQAPWVIDGVLCFVPDAAAHFERARDAGATILSAPEAGPAGAQYRAADLEGHRWMFVQRA